MKAPPKPIKNKDKTNPCTLRVELFEIWLYIRYTRSGFNIIHPLVLDCVSGLKLLQFKYVCVYIGYIYVFVLHKVRK